MVVRGPSVSVVTDVTLTHSSPCSGRMSNSVFTALRESNRSVVVEKGKTSTFLSGRISYR